MKRSPILLGTKRKRRSLKAAVPDFEEEDGWDYDYDLLLPGKIIIADETNGYQLFGDKIFTCPQEDLLEGAAENLCSPVYLLTLICRFLWRIGIPQTQLFGKGGLRDHIRDQKYAESRGHTFTHIGTSAAVLARTYACCDAGAILMA